MGEVVRVEVRGEVAWLTLARPEKLNAISVAMLEGLIAAVARLDGEACIGAAVLSGEGRAFSAGGDITAMAAMDEVEFSRTIGLYMQLANAASACRKPIIGALHGHVLAGGFELSLLCDIRIAAAGTVFALPDTPLGLSPTSGMTYLLPRIVGLGRALDLILSARRISVEEAEAIGLVSRIVPGEALLAEAGKLAEAIAGYPRVGVAGAKAAVYGALDSDLPAATAREHVSEVTCFRDPEVRARLQAFADRRKRS